MSSTRSSEVSPSQAGSSALGTFLRPTREQYGSYLSLVRSLNDQDRPLASRLLEGRPASWSPSDDQEDNESDGGSSVHIHDDSAGSPSDIASDTGADEPNPEPTGTTGGPARRRPQLVVDLTGRPAASPSSVVQARLDDRWPLSMKSLNTSGGEFMSLDDVISEMATAKIESSYRAPNPKKSLHSSPKPSRRIKEDQDAEIEEAEERTVLPPNLMEMTTRYVNSVLVELANLRPLDFSLRKRYPNAMDWEAVLSAASLLKGQDDLARKTSHRMMGIVANDDEEKNIVAHRLDALSKYSCKIPADADLLGPVLLPLQKPKRSHQTEDEAMLRAAKRALKLESRRIKSEAIERKNAIRAEKREARDKKREAWLKDTEARAKRREERHRKEDARATRKAEGQAHPPPKRKRAKR